jgi:hypothetical protein
MRLTKASFMLAALICIGLAGTAVPQGGGSAGSGSGSAIGSLPNIPSGTTSIFATGGSGTLSHGQSLNCLFGTVTATEWMTNDGAIVKTDPNTVFKFTGGPNDKVVVEAGNTADVTGASYLQIGSQSNVKVTAGSTAMIVDAFGYPPYLIPPHAKFAFHTP